jgi:ribosomal protein S18 acetylase RimI-like enzyme
MTQEQALQIRPYRAADREQVMAIAPRLAELVAAWRDPAAVLDAVHGWVRGSIEACDQPDHALYVAVAGQDVVGFVSVSERTHFAGQVDAYVGELAVRSGLERQGIATALMAAAEAWATDRGRAFLTLETGAASWPARGLYRALGFREEEIRLTKPIRAEAG